MFLYWHFLSAFLWYVCSLLFKHWCLLSSLSGAILLAVGCQHRTFDEAGRWDTLRGKNTNVVWYICTAVSMWLMCIYKKRERERWWIDEQHMHRYHRFTVYNVCTVNTLYITIYIYILYKFYTYIIYIYITYLYDAYDVSTLQMTCRFPRSLMPPLLSSWRSSIRPAAGRWDKGLINGGW